MPYIGKNPVGGGFHKLDALTASATDTYALTLNSAAYYPESANQLLVSLNGVIQAPQDSFTVSGSNLVFDTALTSSDSIDFVVALGDVLAVKTVTDGAITTAKLGNGAVTSAKLDTNIAVSGNLDVGTIRDAAGTNTAMTIDSGGRPLIANGKVPCFHVYRSTSQSLTSGAVTTIIYDSNHFLHDWTLNTTTGVLTAGSNAAGIYMLKARGRINTQTDNFASIKMLLNGTNIQSAFLNNEYFDQMEVAMLYEISAGDTMSITMYHTSGSADTVGGFDGGYHAHFFGFRISA
jgi:hypothetical protein